MTRRCLAAFAFVAAAGVAAGFAARTGSSDTGPTAAEAFETLKKLAGDWTGGPDADGNGALDMRVNYRVSSAGSAVVETLFPGQPHEMVTVYHLDGDDLTLTHYCALGNQPRLKASRDGWPREFHFTFAGGCNVEEGKGQYMGEARLKIIDDDHARADWWSFHEGVRAEQPHTFEMTRVKPAAPGAGMEQLFVVTLSHGPNWTAESTPRTQELQKQHLAHIKGMWEAGKALVAGPFADRSGGMIIMRTADADEARTLAEADPAVKAGRLAVSVKPWMVEPGHIK